ncbi:hypothetical protein [Mycobacterium sp. 236(2023)]|uniref:hypothetical protein n=1 Tax=Mycobacterium sp. 236(2023) TaxID=3038163 RepID=UPI002414DB36|nr:hypothetical protein [Mycobacterium sp. 236(2023)]MDG4666165.1 hypothetical protein [Mycobacterium sp. 236(2023)]
MTTDERMWKAATWSTPFAVQAVIAVTGLAAWLLGSVLGTEDDSDRQVVLLSATAVAVAVSVVTGGLLLTRPDPQQRGIALGVFVSAATVLIGGAGIAIAFF